MFNIHQDNRHLDLYDVLNNSYKPIKEQDKFYSQHGYKLDKELSDRFNSVLYNPKEKKMLYTVAGSRSLIDWAINDPALALGLHKNTLRYQTAKETLEEAKKKYHPAQTVVAGHSLGSRIASGIAGSKDKIFTYNGGHSINNKIRDNETAIRVEGDAVSALGSGNKRMNTLKNNSWIKDPYTSHGLHHLKNKKIYI